MLQVYADNTPGINNIEYERQCPVSIVNLHQTSSLAESQGLGPAWLSWCGDTGARAPCSIPMMN